MRMSAWEGTRLETILKATGRDMIINTGAWTNMSVEHTARTGADKGYFMIVPEDCCSTMNADWHTRLGQLRAAERFCGDQRRRRHQSAWMKGTAGAKFASSSPVRHTPTLRSSGRRARLLDRFRQARPDWDIDVMNLWKDYLPEFEGYILEAKYARLGGRGFTDSQRDAFAVAERIAVRLALADRVLISTPMWNFGIPYKLKQWIDVITQPGLTFPVRSAQGYLPLLKEPADGCDPRQWQRFRHRHEPRPHRHGDALFARGAPLHRYQQRALRAGRPDDWPA